jgi:hypothetical protein
MAIGKVRTRDNSKNENFQSIDDPLLRTIANAVGDKINLREKQEVLWYYQSPQVAKLMREERIANMQKPKTIRKSLRIPGAVMRFLDAYFEPEYGSDWIHNKKLWNHELVKPWKV